MTLSVKIVLEMIENGQLDNLGFILTVIRDNCLCDSTFELLDLLLNSMEKNGYELHKKLN